MKNDIKENFKQDHSRREDINILRIFFRFNLVLECLLRKWTINKRVIYCNRQLISAKAIFSRNWKTIWSGLIMDEEKKIFGNENNRQSFGQGHKVHPKVNQFDYLGVTLQ